MVTTSAAEIPRANRRNGKSVTMNLLDKVAAARKEHLSTLGKPVIGDQPSPSWSVKENPTILRARQASKLIDVQLTYNSALRTSAVDVRKNESRSHPQILRTTHFSSKGPQAMATNAPTANGTVASKQRVESKRSRPVGLVPPTSRRWHVLPPRHHRFGTLDSPTELQQSNLDVLPNKPRVRPATASRIRSSGTYDNLGGYARKSAEVVSTLRSSSIPAQNCFPDVIDSLQLERPKSHTGVRRAKTQADFSTKNKGNMAGSEEPVRLTKQEVHFAYTAEIPGVPIVYRNQKAKKIHSERLSLDRRSLPVIPLLEGEQTLRLLNLQNNVIRRIDNLLGLPNLIFLNLYNNRIEKLENLHVVPNLRVLLMGRNRLRSIENLACLKRLDVLDLHSNEIEQMQHLNDLKELRVLNLGENLISTVKSLDNLTRLTELNLRRNRISSIQSIGELPSLSRLYLSDNKLETFESIEPLFQILSINELRLDSNGCLSTRKEYRERIVSSFPSLKHLDLQPLTDQEEALQRAVAPNKASDPVKAESRTLAISRIKTAWEKRTELATSLKEAQNVPIFSSWGVSAKEKIFPIDNCKEQETMPTSREDPIVYNNGTGFSEIEVYNDYRVLAIYGNALKALEFTKAHADVIGISFRYVNIGTIKAAITYATNANLKLFPHLKRLIFAFNDLESFDKLVWVNSMGSKAEEVFISQNPVCVKTLLKHFVGARIPNILQLNGEEITPTDRQLGEQLFPQSNTLSVAKESGSLIMCKDQKGNVSELMTSRVVLKNHGTTTPSIVTDVIEAAIDIKTKTTVLDQAWHNILLTMVKKALQDIGRRDDFMACCLDDL